jgi:hypothetical protein
MTDPANEPRRQALPTARDLLALTGRPTQAIAHPAWSKARERVLALVTAGPAMIVVLGPPGTGKTVLLRDLAATFRERAWSACLLDFGDRPFDVGPGEIVLVDEADRMSPTRLDELRSRGDVPIILAALPASEERFARYPGVTVVRLSPLSPQEARAFLLERLTQMGLSSGCLTGAAWTQLIASGHGVPRLLLISLGLALFLASEEQAERVTDAHVEQAVEANGGSTGATVEPGHMGANPTQWSMDGTIFKDEDETIFRDEDESIAEGETKDESTFKEEGISADTALNWPREAPSYRWRNRLAATAFAAAYLVAVVTLLSWADSQMNDRTPSGSDALKVAQTTPAPDHGLAQETRGSHSVSDAPVSAMAPTPIPVPGITTASTQPDPASPASAASFQQQSATTSRLAAVAVATQPFGANVPAPAWNADHPLGCGDGNWAWDTCRTHPRRVVWHRVRRCFIALGNLCLAASYHYVRAK